MRMPGRALAVTVVGAGLIFAGMGVAYAAVVEELVSPARAAQGEGWAIHPDQTDGGHERFVEGPATPPAGRGSLEMSVDSTTDLSLVFTVPRPGTQEAWPWGGLTGEYSTFTYDEIAPGGSTPALRIIGYQVFQPPPVGASGFTTLIFTGDLNGTITPGQWQTWTLGPDSLVTQSNASDGFCVQPTTCTLAQFAAQYPDGAWGQVQVGVGTGSIGGSRGFADAISVSQDGTELVDADFEIPAESNSTATIVAGEATETGGTATVTLNASELAADSVVFEVVMTGPDGEPVTTLVEVAPGESETLELAVPFGSTTITVSAQDVVIAEEVVTFEAPPEPTPSPTASAPATPSPSPSTTAAPVAPVDPDEPELAVSGRSTAVYGWTSAALMALGSLAVALGRRNARPAEDRVDR
jgi:hypothetical protein